MSDLRPSYQPPAPGNETDVTLPWDTTAPGNGRAAPDAVTAARELLLADRRRRPDDAPATGTSPAPPGVEATPEAPAPPDTAGRAGPVRFTVVILGLSLALLAAMTIGVSLGSVRVSVTDVWAVVAANLRLPVSGPGDTTDTIIWTVRTPRVVLAALVGAGLATVGATLQSAVRNPIADPYVLGISQGASVGAVVVIAFGAGAFLGVWALSVAAFLGAVTVAVVVLLIASRRTLSPLRIVLTGIAVGYAASALTSFLIYRAPDADSVRTIMFWLLGSLAGASWTKLLPSAVAVLSGLVVLWAHGRHLNALLAGDDTAAALGIAVGSLRRRLVVLTSLITAVVVAVSGMIGFVGLLLPHVGRALVGNDHRKLLPVTALSGATFMVLVDLVARTAASPQEIPVGIITAGVGAPFFLWVLNRRTATGGATR